MASEVLHTACIAELCHSRMATAMGVKLAAGLEQ